LATFDSFQPYSTSHAAVIFVFLAITALPVVLARRWRGTGRDRTLDRLIAIACLFIWVTVKAFRLLPSRYDPSKAIPLQVCDWVGLVAPLAIWTGWRPLRAILYFWGLGLSSQAFIQPDLAEGPADPSFWAFWGGHAAIVGAALYDLAGRRFHPTWRDYGTAVGALAVWLAVVLPFDVLTGFNYGYVGNSTPGQPTIVDVLGPWPARVPIIAALVAAALALIELPWDIARRSASPRRLAASSSPPVTEPPAPLANTGSTA
jgi:hypothetical integral membrane protein (TIGR02206 family)